MIRQTLRFLLRKREPHRPSRILLSESACRYQQYACKIVRMLSFFSTRLSVAL